jgi:hypothetical protein
MPANLTTAFYRKGKVILVEPLGSQVKLGSVGYLDDGQWIEVGTTRSMFKMALSSAPGSTQPNSFDGKSGKGLKFEAKLAGEASGLVPKAGDAKARAEITFGSEGAFVMNVKNQTVTTARELAALMAAIRFAYRYRKALPEGERWEKHYAVIVGLASAESITALSSSSAKAAVIVTGNGSVAAPAIPAQLEATMTISYSSESVDKLWRGPAAGYAFQALRISPSMFTVWDREDVVFLKPRGLSFARPAPTGKPPRPKSYLEWAKAARTKPQTAHAELLTPSGSAAVRGTLTELIRPNGKRKHSRSPTRSRS